MGVELKEPQVAQQEMSLRDVQQLTEQIVDWRAEGLQLDATRRLVKNVALTGQRSKNGYEYKLEALRNAVPLYADKPVFLDHANQVTRPTERSARDLIGSVVNVRFEQNRIKGDIQVVDTDAGRTFWALAESNHPSVGMSHVVLAQRSADRKMVEKIHEVVSVDAVVFPATNSNLSESVEPKAEPDLLEGSYEQVLQMIDDLLPEHLDKVNQMNLSQGVRRGLFDSHVVVSAVATEEEDETEVHSVYLIFPWRQNEGGVELSEHYLVVTEDEIQSREWQAREDLPRFADEGRTAESRLRCLQKEYLLLRKRLQKYKEQERFAREEQEIRLLLEKSGLRGSAITDLFVSQLKGAKKLETRQALIEERLLLTQKQPRELPVSQLRESQRETDPDIEIVRLLKAG